MTLREELRDAVLAVDTARANLAEAREEIAQLEALHRSLYAARTAGIAAERTAEGEAKRLRLVLYQLQRQDGEWNPGEALYGLAVHRHHLWSYTDRDAAQWLVKAAAAGNQDAWDFLMAALDKSRISFEALLRRVPRQELWSGLAEREEPRVVIAGPSLPTQIQATEEAEAAGPAQADDAIADLARRMTETGGGTG